MTNSDPIPATEIVDEVKETIEEPVAEKKAPAKRKPAASKTAVKDDIKEYPYGNVTTVSISDIVIETGFNARFDFGEEDGTLQELSDSILENGIMQPLKVFHDLDAKSENFNKLVLIDGHRRIKAIKLIDLGVENDGQDLKKIEILKNIPVLIAANTITQSERTFEMLLSGNGRPLSKLEQGTVYNKLINVEKAFTVMELAKKLGKTHTYISDAITLATAPEAVQEAVKAGEITPTAAVTTTREQKKRGATDEQITEKVSEMVTEAKAKGKTKASNQEIKEDDKPAEKSTTTAKKEKAVVEEAAKLQKKPVSLTEISKVFNELCERARDVEDNDTQLTMFSNLMEDLSIEFENAVLEKTKDGADMILLNFFTREREHETLYYKMFAPENEIKELEKKQKATAKK